MNALLKIAAAVVASFVIAMSGNAGDQDFTLVNETGVEIYKIYTSPHSSDDWEEDVLNDDTLPSGESVEISFSPSESAKYWDIRVEDEEGNSIEWTKLNLLEISTVTLYYEDGKSWAELE